jgi:hypothetical protein
MPAPSALSGAMARNSCVFTWRRSRAEIHSMNIFRLAEGLPDRQRPSIQDDDGAEPDGG